MIIAYMKRNILKFTNRDLAYILWSFGRIGVYDEDIMSVVGEILS